MWQGLIGIAQILHRFKNLRSTVPSVTNKETMQGMSIKRGSKAWSRLYARFKAFLTWGRVDHKESPACQVSLASVGLPESEAQSDQQVQKESRGFREYKGTLALKESQEPLQVISTLTAGQQIQFTCRCSTSTEGMPVVLDMGLSDRTGTTV